MASEKAAAESLKQLIELGYDPGAPPEQALAILRALREKAGVSHGAIAHALGTLPSADAAAMLAEMEAGARGADRREIRRALFKLRQRGIEPPHQATAPARQPTAMAPSEVGLSALLSATDIEGGRVVWLLKSRPGGGVRRLWMLVSERDGLLGANLAVRSSREIRSERAELERVAGTPLVDADWRLADFILCEANRRTPASRRSEAGDFLAVRAEFIASPPPADFVHPVYAEFAAESTVPPSLDLLKEPEIAMWRLAPERVKPYADQVTDLQQSVIVVNRMTQEERLNTTVERAVGELLEGETAARLRRHLEDAAYYLARTNRRAAAGAATAAAANIRDGVDLRRIPFFVALLRAQLGELLAERQEHERDEPRLIMTPAEALRARQAAQARTRQRPR